MISVSENLEKEIKNSENPVLVEFWSSWCAPCQSMKPVMEDFEKNYGDKIKILKINPDLNASISQDYDVKGLPTFILFKEGKEVRREVGVKSKSDLEKLVSDFLRK